MGSISGGGSASRQRSSGDSSEAVRSNQDATFNSPEGKQLLTYLTGQTTGGGAQKYADTAAGAYTKQASGAVNPEVENIIKASNYEGDRAAAGGMAKLRTQGYRGGTAANIFNQGTFANDYASKLAGENAKTRYGAFNDAQNRSLAGASGLANMAQGQNSLGAQILALLRGESKAGTDIKHTSGTVSGTDANISGTYQFA